MKLETDSAILGERVRTLAEGHEDFCERLSGVADAITDLRLELKGLAVKASIYFGVLAAVAGIAGPIVARKLWGG